MGLTKDLTDLNENIMMHIPLNILQNYVLKQFFGGQWF